MGELLEKLPQPELTAKDSFLDLVSASIREELQYVVDPDFLGLNFEQVMPLFSGEVIKAADQLRQPMSLDDFQKQRLAFFEESLDWAGRLDGGFFHFWPRWVLNTSGWFVAKEYEDLYLRAWSRNQDGLDFNFLRREVDSHFNRSVFPEQKKLENLERAGSLIRNLRRLGYRTMVTIGGFDYGTAAHTRFLDEIGQKAGRYTAIIALVSSNRELQITRSENRPFTDLEGRLDSVASHWAVHWVAPVHLPEEVQDRESLIQFWYAAHQQLQPHFRVIGETDDPRRAVFQDQCDQAHINLLFSERGRPGRATHLIDRVRKIS
jgi:hypothetical protein